MGVQKIDVSRHEPFSGTPLGHFILEQASAEVKEQAHKLTDVRCICGEVFQIDDTLDLDTAGICCPSCNSFSDDSHRDQRGLVLSGFTDLDDDYIDSLEQKNRNFWGCLEYKHKEEAIFLNVIIDEKRKSKIGPRNATIFLKVGKISYKIMCSYRFDTTYIKRFDGESWTDIPELHNEYDITFIGNKTWDKKKYSSTLPSSELQDILNRKLKPYILEELGIER